jgi:peroxin-1
MGTPAITAFGSLRNALVNIPPKLEAALNASNTLAQNVVVQISWKDSGKEKNVYTGWTGVSCQKATSPTDSRKNDGVPMFEIDPAFAANVGLREGTRVQLTVHQDPAIAHTIHVEPLTANDWEIIVHQSLVLIDRRNSIQIPWKSISSFKSELSRHCILSQYTCRRLQPLLLTLQESNLL